MRFSFLYCTFFVCLSLSVGAQSNPTPKITATIDWSRERIYFDGELSHAVGKSNATLRTLLREAMLKKLSTLIDGLWNKSQAHKGELPPSEELDLSKFWTRQSLATFQVAENRASATMEIPLRGRDSLMAYLPFDFGSELFERDDTKNEIAYEKRPNAREYDNVDAEPILYTSLVVDARHLAFVPSLNTEIVTSSGRLIYGVEFMNRQTGVKRGVAAFCVNEKDPKALARTGKRPLRVAALDLAHDTQNALVISDEDAAKLLAHAGSVQNLRRARVVILLPKTKLREVY